MEAKVDYMNILNLNNLTVEHNKLLNDISLEIKGDYHKLIQELYLNVDNSIFWNVNSLLSRNNFLSKVFFDLCYLELVKRISNESQISEIIVLNHAQKDILKNYFNKKQIKIIFVSNKKKQIKDFFKPYYTFFLNFSFSFFSIVTRRAKRKNKLLNVKSEITIIDTFVTPFEIESGKYISRHYPKEELWDYLSLKDKKSVYFVPEIVGSINIISIINKLNLSDESFIFKNDFLKITDYCKALLSPLFIKKINFDSFLFRDFKISPLLKADFYINISNPNSFKGILNYYFFKRVKESGIKLKLVVNWFENQPFDKGFNSGVRYFYPNTKAIGIQPFVQDLDFSFHLCPIKIEEDMQVIPKSIVVIGKKFEKLINKFYKDLNVKLGPSIRYKYLHSINEKHLSFTKKHILIALPISLKESRDIITVISDLFENKNEFFRTKTWILKPHPDLNLILLEAEFVKIFKNFTIVIEPINDLLLRSSAIITNGSTVAFEAIVFGVPVCIIGAQNGFTQNPIPKDIDSKIWELCYTENDLYNFLYKISQYNDKDRKHLIEISKQTKIEYFEPINSNSVNRLLNLE
jgi:hypothetical protein|tara:strand:+ start:1491 stop:3221 length:1731 start_codon:yes stop_codon:yes gene_type:complete